MQCVSPKSVTGTGEILRCEKSTCDYCLLANAGRLVGAIRLAAPTHTFGLTLVGDDGQTIRASTRKWLRALRRITSLRIETCWAAEMGPEDTNPHVHGYLWASGSISEVDMISAVEKAGLGREYHFQDRREESGWDEVAAEFFAYIFKSLASDELRGSFLELNRSGAKATLHHNTPGFFKSGADGKKLTLREAKKEAYRLHRLAKDGGSGSNPVLPQDEHGADAASDASVLAGALVSVEDRPKKGTPLVRHFRVEWRIASDGWYEPVPVAIAPGPGESPTQPPEAELARPGIFSAPNCRRPPEIDHQVRCTHPPGRWREARTERRQASVTRCTRPGRQPKRHAPHNRRNSQ